MKEGYTNSMNTVQTAFKMALVRLSDNSYKMIMCLCACDRVCTIIRHVSGQVLTLAQN